MIFLFFRLHRQTERKLLFFRELLDSLDFGFGDLFREDPRDTHPVVVNMEHDSNGVLLSEPKDQLEPVDDEVSGGVVLIVKQDPVQPGPLKLLLRLDLRDGTGVVVEPLGHTPT